MPLQCRVLNCNSKGSTGFHPFPSNENVRKQWITLTKSFQWEDKINTDTNSFYRVCKKHFKDSDYVNGRLITNSLPSRFLPDHTDHAYQWTSINHKLTKTLGQCREKQSFKKRLTNIVTNYSEATTSDYNAYGESSPMEVDVENVYKENKLNCSREKLMKSNSVGPKLKTTKSSSQTRKIRYLTNQVKLLRQKRKAEKWNNENLLKHLKNQCNNQQQFDLIAMQVRNFGKKRKGYTQPEKNLSLAMHKQSPKKYRFLKKFLCLPSRRTLGRHSAKLIFETGINPKLFEYIRERVKDLPEIDKNCFLVWDEIGLKAHLDYSQSRDLIDGFVDLEDIRRPTFSTHSLAFMIRGINTPFKQSVTYYNTDNLKGFELAELVTRVTEAVFDTGLRVVGSVSDQEGSNKTAVKHLMGPENFIEGELLKYKFRGKTILHCWDIPHLLKGIRNNMLTKNLTHFILKRWDVDDTSFFENMSKEELVASWNDVSSLYDYTLQSSQRLLPKITNEHIKPEKLKMKVSLATQVFSATYGNMMLRCSEQNQLSHDCSSTSQILLFFNDLFDSLNGSALPLNDELKSAVTETSNHFSYWEYALNVLSLMNFVDKETGETTHRTKVLLNFSSTIRGYIAISQLMLNEGSAEVAIRNTNQDALERDFGIIRSCCQAPVAPIAIHYRSAFTTMIVNNLSSVNSISTNCEEDTGVPLLSNVHELLLTDKKTNNENYNDDIICDEVEILDSIVFDPQLSSDELSFLEKLEKSHTASLICKNILQRTKCKHCRNSLQSNSKITEYNNPETKESIKNPSNNFMIHFETVMSATNQKIPVICAEKNLKKKVLSDIDKMTIDGLGCSKHSPDITKLFKEYIIVHGINSFCKNINDYLSGKITQLPKKYNSIQQLAQLFRAKKKHVVKHSNIFTGDDNKIIKTKIAKNKKIAKAKKVEKTKRIVKTKKTGIIKVTKKYTKKTVPVKKQTIKK